MLIFAAVLVTALFLFAQYVRRASMFFPERYPAGLWDTAILTNKPADHSLQTGDGVRLHGWLFRAEDSAPLMIWLHGNGGNITERAQIADEFASRGVSVFLVDYRGYGRSEGTPSESKLYLDALAAYDYAKKELGARSIAAYGESLGGPYAAYLATKRPVTCVVIESSFPSMRDLGNALYAPLPMGWFAPFAMNTAGWLNEARVPVLVMHGRRDQVIPFALGRKLYDSLRGPKEMLVSETATHSTIADVEGRRYFETVVSFVKRY
jgi:fermentation-respiration switch protein FrsA (DUF1100 family)